MEVEVCKLPKLAMERYTIAAFDALKRAGYRGRVIRDYALGRAALSGPTCAGRPETTHRVIASGQGPQSAYLSSTASRGRSGHGRRYLVTDARRWSTAIEEMVNGA